ncbi:hypothetical protein WMO63_21615 [Niallia sp. CLA-SR-H024]|uniref:Uncharacterized protein n=1 Tax=Niallia hominis TaxID=3133173 RepID=A0ABV1F636_9BACI
MSNLEKGNPSVHDLASISCPQKINYPSKIIGLMNENNIRSMGA